MTKTRGPFADLLPWQWAALFALCGVFALEYPVAGITAGALLAGLMFLARPLPLALSWALAAFLLGTLWVWLHAPGTPPSMPEWMKDRTQAEVRARVHAVRFKPENRIQILLSDVHCRGQGFEQVLSGMTVLTWQDPPRIPAPGQEIRARLRIKPIDGFDNFHTWDSRAYWARQGVFHRSFVKGEADPPIRIHGDPGTLWTWRQALRSRVLAATEPGPGQGLLLALLMADRSKLEYETLDLVRRASLAHSLALSGLHLGFVLTLGWAAARGIGYFRPGIFLVLPRPLMSIALGAPLVIAYLWLGQGRESLVRAALMFFFWAVLLLAGRSKALLDGLFFALLVFLIWDPLAVFSLGWQLSMVAVAGILLLWPLIGTRFDAQRSGVRKALSGLLSVFLLSLTANIALLPLLMADFGQLSPHIYLNMLWLPVLGFCVLPLGLVGMSVSVCPGMSWLGNRAMHLAGDILEMMSGLLKWLNAQGWLEVVVTPRPGWAECVGYWLLLGAVIAAARSTSAKNVLAGGLGLGMIAVPWLTAGSPDQGGAVRLRVLDVGQGQAVCLKSPEGERVLIDGGGSWNPDFDLGRYALSPALTYRALPRVDTVVLTHPDFDHLRGLFYILRHYHVGRFVFNGQWPTGEDRRTLEEIISRKEFGLHKARAGDRLQIGDDLNLEVLHPGRISAETEDNDASLVLRVCHQGKGLALIPGDIEQPGIADLLDSGRDMRADVLVVPHHGSRGSLSQELYQRVDPEIAVASCGFLNIFHFPHPEVGQALGRAGVPLYSTSRAGEVRVEWDPRSLEIGSVRTRLGDEGPVFHRLTARGAGNYR
jgi:competence protein ComEC